MKKFSTPIYICITLLILNIFIFIFQIRYFSIQKEQSVFQAPEVPVYPMTSDITVPEEIALAGEKVPLHRPDIQEALRKELIVNTYLHSHTIQILKTAPRIFQRIEPILKKNGIPDDFKYLAVIESKLEPSAISPAGAVGLWQFMKNTGAEFGLEINDEIDERYNIEKSTQAAADYLKKAYRRFGNWTLAAASYNAGAAMIDKQMQIQRESDYYNLLLGEETERYVFRILALKQILTHPELYNFYVDEHYPIEEFKKIEVKTSVHDWAEFAKKQGVTYKTLKRFNPWLRKNKLKNPKHKTYEILLPVEKQLYK